MATSKPVLKVLELVTPLVGCGEVDGKEDDDTIVTALVALMVVDWEAVDTLGRDDMMLVAMARLECVDMKLFAPVAAVAGVAPVAPIAGAAGIAGVAAVAAVAGVAAVAAVAPVAPIAPVAPVAAMFGLDVEMLLVLDVTGIDAEGTAKRLVTSASLVGVVGLGSGPAAQGP